MPKKVYLDSYVLCQFSEVSDRTYQLNYRGKTSSDSVDVFNYVNYEYVEVSSKDSIVIDIEPQFSAYETKMNIIDYNLNGKEVPFYLFKIDRKQSYNYYDFCNNAKKEDAFKVITVKFNVSEADLKLDEAVPIKY